GGATEPYESVAPPGLVIYVIVFQGFRGAFGLLHPWLPAVAPPGLRQKPRTVIGSGLWSFPTLSLRGTHTISSTQRLARSTSGRSWCRWWLRRASSLPGTLRRASRSVAARPARAAPRPRCGPAANRES